jgi:hypothetical protein
MRDRGQFLLDYLDLLLLERVGEADGFRHVAPSAGEDAPPPPQGRDGRSRERWVINKLRALCAWYTKGLDGGSALRVRINSAESLAHLRAIVTEFFLSPDSVVTSDETLSSVR